MTAGVVWRWKLALGVGREDPPGTRRLLKATRARGADATRGKRLPPDQVEARRERAHRLRLGDFLEDYSGYQGEWWSNEEMDLLGTAPDAVIAAKVGRTVNAVRLKRNELRIPTADDKRLHPRRRRKAGPNHPWRKRRQA